MHTLSSIENNEEAQERRARLATMEDARGITVAWGRVDVGRPNRKSDNAHFKDNVLAGLFAFDALQKGGNSYNIRLGRHIGTTTAAG